MQIGPSQGNPVKWAQDIAGQIYGVHYKDFVFDSSDQRHDTVVGEGTLDLKPLVGNPVPALTKCVVSMRALAG
jgi:hypothetical protein